MALMKDMKLKLDRCGYTNHWKLKKEKELATVLNDDYSLLDPCERLLSNAKHPLCHHIDIIIPEKKRTSDRLYQLQQFLDLVGTPIPDPTVKTDISNSALPRHSYIIDDELRNFRIHEFIQTETSYVSSLQAVLKYVVQPLTTCTNQKPILTPYKSSKIFLNLALLVKVNQDFLNDLHQMNGTNYFGAVCADHIPRFSCYRKYLLEQHEAQKLHAKEIKSNTLYRRFLAQDRPGFKRRRFQDLLLEPVQRISRYAMMLKDILNLTPPDHPDFTGLREAWIKVREIATMADDPPTKMATLLLNLYQSIKNCPCSLINPNRSLVTFVDAMEIQRDTNKPARAVTLFVFNDKIMVTTRSSQQRTEEDMVWSEETTQGATKKETMKFKGWINIEQVEIFKGNQELPDSFMLYTLDPPQSERRDSVSSITFEKYFRKGPRLFTISHPTNLTDGFRHTVERTKALARLYNQEDEVYERQWNGIHTYSNVYTAQNYTLAKTKNNMTILYMEESDDLNFESLFTTCLPWVIAIVQSDTRGFRFHLCGRNPFQNDTAPQPPKDHQSIEFEYVFWNNIILCERQLRSSPVFSCLHDKFLRHEINRKSRSRSVPRPLTTTLGKLFTPPIVSPRTTSNPCQVIPGASKSTPIKPIPPTRPWHSFTHPPSALSPTTATTATTTARARSLSFSSSSTTKQEPLLCNRQQEIKDDNKSTISSLKSTSSQEQDPWLEMVAGAVETMGWQVHEKWRNLASQHQALNLEKEPWQDAYTSMIHETFSLFTDLTTELDQLAAMVNTHRNK